MIWDSFKKILEIQIRPGYKSGTKIRFEGEGDELIGQPRQDLVFILKERKHDRFKRDSDNLIYDVNISITESLCGFSKTIEGIDNISFNLVNKGGGVAFIPTPLVKKNAVYV